MRRGHCYDYVSCAASSRRRYWLVRVRVRWEEVPSLVQPSPQSAYRPKGAADVQPRAIPGVPRQRTHQKEHTQEFQKRLNLRAAG